MEGAPGTVHPAASAAAKIRSGKVRTASGDPEAVLFGEIPPERENDPLLRWVRPLQKVGPVLLFSEICGKIEENEREDTPYGGTDLLYCGRGNVL